MHYTVKQRLKQDYKEIKDHCEKIISADRLLHYRWQVLPEQFVLLSYFQTKARLNVFL